MKKIIFTMLCAPILVFANNSFEDSWVSAVTLCAEKKFEKACDEFTKAINSLEKTKSSEHAHVYIDRGRAYMLAHKYEHALRDLNKGLNNELSLKDRVRGLLTRGQTHMELGHRDEAVADYEEYMKLSPDNPEFTMGKDRIIIRNASESSCARESIKQLMLSAKVCDSEADIKFFPSGIIVIERSKDCGCEKKNAAYRDQRAEREKDCLNWCSRFSVMGGTFCGSTFKSAKCQLMCAGAVQLLTEGCQSCCADGDYYQNCVEPFNDILGKMDSRICAPEW
jgi:tetratricopeptide (TPR) repeat protein